MKACLNSVFRRHTNSNINTIHTCIQHELIVVLVLLVEKINKINIHNTFTKGETCAKI